MKYLCVFLLAVGLASCSKEDSAKAEYKEQYVKIAETIAAQIPKNSRVSLTLTSPDKNGLPEVFLKKLMAEFSGALVQSSKSRFQILNRNSTEELWQEAVEFNNQDAAKITKSAGADVSVALSPKVNESGIDLSVTAYSLKEESMGNVLASASELIPMNVKAELGVDVKNLDKKIDKIAQLLDKDSSIKDNELSKLFIKFAEGSDTNGLVRTYANGCQKPSVINTNKPSNSTYLYYDKIVSGLNMKCEVYDSGKLVVYENSMLDTTINVEMYQFIDDYAHSVNAMTLSTSQFGNFLTIPAQLRKYMKPLGCNQDVMATTGSSMYKLNLPNIKEPIYVTYAWSGGTAGNNMEIYLFREPSRKPASSPPSPPETYSKANCSDWEPLEMGI